MSSKMATLHECHSVYSLEDVYALLEISAVDAHNQRVFDEAARADKER